jgi:hypothetical protein
MLLDIWVGPLVMDGDCIDDLDFETRGIDWEGLTGKRILEV